LSANRQSPTVLVSQYWGWFTGPVRTWSWLEQQHQLMQAADRSRSWLTWHSTSSTTVWVSAL